MFIKSKLIIICCLVTIVILPCISSMTDAEIRTNFIKNILVCARENNVELSKVMALVTYTVPNNNEVKCVLACGYRKLEILNDAGLYDLEAGIKLSKKLMEGDKVRLNNSMKVAEICSKDVNQATVTDGEKGCERAALIFKCVIKNAPKFGFKI